MTTVKFLRTECCLCVIIFGALSLPLYLSFSAIEIVLGVQFVWCFVVQKLFKFQSDNIITRIIGKVLYIFILYTDLF